MWGLQWRGSAAPLRKGLEAGPGQLCCRDQLPGEAWASPAAWGFDRNGYEAGGNHTQLAIWVLPGPLARCVTLNVSLILGSVTEEES